MQYINTTLNPIVGIPNDWADLTGSLSGNTALVELVQTLINKALYFSDLNSLTQALDTIIGDDGELYVGGLPDVAGTWRIRTVNAGDNLLFEKYDGANWEVKGSF